MVILVGAGLAGLACATRLEKAGVEWLLLESDSKPGGRVATEITEEGYRLDAGFQVLLDSYPTACKLIDYDSLKPRYFQSGALLVEENGSWERVLNPLAHPRGLIPLLLTPSFSLQEKISFAFYAARKLIQSDESLLLPGLGISTFNELAGMGLDGAILEKFLRPFFAGVFLESELGTDASVFRYDLKKFVLGRALLPAGGMGNIPEQLASRLPTHRLRYGATVSSLHYSENVITGIGLSDGGRVECSELVLATDEATTRRLLRLPEGRPWLGVTTLYFTGEEALYEGALLVLPQVAPGQHRLVSHFTDLTNTAPEYAPPGKRLLSATVLNPPAMDPQELAASAQSEISLIFPGFSRWRFLKEIRIPRAIPPRDPGFLQTLLPPCIASNLLLAGDQIGPVGIESALASGIRTAELLLDRS